MQMDQHKKDRILNEDNILNVNNACLFVSNLV